MKRLRTIALAACLGALALTGCSTGSTDDDSGSSSSTKAEADAFPVTIEHAFGETTIESEPTRVATLGWADQDHVLALGVVPVGRDQAHLRRQRGRVLGLVRRRGRGGWSRGPGPLRRRRRCAHRRDRQALARPDPRHQLGHHRAGVRQAHQDRSGRRLPGGAVGDPVADRAGDRRPGARPHRGGREGQGRHGGDDRGRQGGQPRARGQVTDLRLPDDHGPLHGGHLLARRTRGSRSCTTSA